MEATQALPAEFVDQVPVTSGFEAKDMTQADASTGLVQVDQARAIAEVQAGIVVAQMRPRDENGAYLRIIKSCKRKSLAEQATYAFPRGGKMVTGPSIRLAEEIARHWGNITYGLRELARKNGSSEIEAFAWDLETNTRVTRQFQMNHIRDTKQGPKAITDERDIYEYVASMGQRRVRACILEIIPGDIVDAAEAECKKTLEAGGGIPLEDRIRAMLTAFDGHGITQAMIEKRIGHPVKSIIPQELVTLQQVFQSIKDGVAKREAFFDLTVTGEAPATEAKEEKAKTTRTKKAEAPEEPPKTNGNGKAQKITMPQAQILSQQMQEFQVSVASFKRRFEVNNIEDLSATMYEDALAWINAEIDKQNQ